MLFDGDGIVGSTLDRRVISDDHRLAPMNTPDTGDDTGGRRFVAIVHSITRQRRELQKRAFGIEQTPDAITNEQFAALRMTFARVLRATLANALDFASQPRHLRLHHLAIVLELRAAGINPRLDPFHDFHQSRWAEIPVDHNDNNAMS